MNQEIFKNLKRISEEYSKGTNLIHFIKNELNITNPPIDPIIASYDFQSGSYIEFIKENPEYLDSYTKLIAETISNLEVGQSMSILEAGCGELTTFTNVINKITLGLSNIFAFDASLSRIHLGKSYFRQTSLKDSPSFFFVADLFNIPLADNSVDVIYTSHALEPNGGKETEAIKELLRVSKRYVVLFEPSYENACDDGKKRMETHGYIKDLKGTIEKLDLGQLITYSKVENPASELNPTWIHVIKKSNPSNEKINDPLFICPLTKEPLIQSDDNFFVPKMLSYPIVHKIPYLMGSHAILSSKI